jgi:hypothetical protein
MGIHICSRNVAKLNSTEMDFWRRSTRISRKDKIRNNIIKQKMNVTRSLLDEIKTKQLQCYGYFQGTEEGRLPKEIMKWRPPGGRKRGRHKLTWVKGIKGIMREMDRWKKTGMMEITGGRNNIIVKWVQEDVKTLYNLLNNNGDTLTLTWSIIPFLLSFLTPTHALSHTIMY